MSATVLLGAALVPVVLAVCFVISERRLLYIALVIMVLDASFRKYVVNDPLVFFVKDCVVAILYVRVLLLRPHRARSAVPRGVRMALAIFALVVLIEVFNPRDPSLTIGLLGLRSWLWYVPLMAVVPEVFESPSEVLSFFLHLSLWAIPLTLFGLAQAAAGPTAPISLTYSKSPAELTYDAIATSKGVIQVFRVPSVFASSSSFANWLYFAAFWAVAVWLGSAPERRNRLRVGLVLAAVVVGDALAGQSALAVTLVVVLPIAVLFSLRQAETRSRGVGFLGSFLAVVMFASVAVTIGLPSVVGLVKTGENRAVSPISDPSYLQERLSVHLVGALETSLLRAPLGFGTGMASNGIQYVPGATVLLNGVYALGQPPEGGYAQAVWELGIPGLLVLLWMFTALIYAIAGRWPSATSNRASIGILVAGLGSVLGLVGWFAIVQKLSDATFAVPFWLTMGGCWVARRAMIAAPALDHGATGRANVTLLARSAGTA